MQSIAIYPHSAYPTVNRKIEVVGKNEDYESESVTLLCRIRHTDQEGERIKALAPIEKDLILLKATDESIVDPQTGALLPINTPGGVGQYTWLKTAIEAGANPFILIEGAVLEAASMGRFD